MPGYLRGGHGTPLVALHGNFASKAWFQGLVDRPPAGLEVLAPDLPGFGDNAAEGRDEPAIEFFADAVEAWLAALQVERPFLLGHSLGGAVALEMAARQPQAYRGLILLSSSPLSGFKTPFFHYPVMQRYRTDRKLLKRSLALLFRTRVDLESLVDEARRMHPGGFTGNARALAHWSVTDRIERLRQLPLLLMGGDEDPIIRPAEVRAMAKQLPHAQVRIARHIAHAWMLDAPEQFAEELRGFTAS
ncbi:MAG: alpha/beta fold hydrolase [Candidatus Xenobia bacterium]